MGIVKFLMGLLKSNKTPLTDKTLIKKFLKDNPGNKPDLSDMDLPVGLQKVITKQLNANSGAYLTRNRKPNIDQIVKEIAKDFKKGYSGAKNSLSILKDKKKPNGTSLVIPKNKNVTNPNKKIVIDGDPIKKIKKVGGSDVSVKSGAKSLLKKKTPTMANKNNKTFTSTIKNIARKGLNNKKKLAAITGASIALTTLPSKTLGDATLKKNKNTIIKDPKIKKPITSKVIKKELPKLKSNDYTGRFIDKKGDVAYDSASDFLAHMFGTPKKRAMPKKSARIFGGTGDKLKRKDADTKGAGKGVKFKAFKSGTKDKTIGKPISYKKALEDKYKNKSKIYGMIYTPTGQKSKRKRTMVEKIFGGGPNENYNRKINEAKKVGKKLAGYEMFKEHPELMKRARKEDTTKKSGGSLSSDKYVAKQIRGWGKARKPKG